MRTLLSIALLAVVSAAPRASESVDPALAEVLTRFDRVQSSLRTLSAGLTMTTYNRLLKEPVVYHGHFYMTTPDAVRWEFDSPEEMRFVIADGQYVGYYPDRKKAERKNIERWSRRLFRYFGLGQGSQELRRSYTIALGADEGDAETYLLILEPRKRRARKRIEQVRFTIDRKTMLPVRVEYQEGEGDLRVVEFDDVRVNVDLPTALYRLELPADVEVSTAFTAFGSAPEG